MSICWFFLSVAFSARADTSLAGKCAQQLQKLQGPVASWTDLERACAQTVQLEPCVSTHGTPISHFERLGSNSSPKRILAIALIHGDEPLSGGVARAWMLRLHKIHPRNSWRVIPVANPDGWERQTRTNTNGVDLNRNFPTQDWAARALSYWHKEMKSDPRRFPGPTAASETETRCLMREIEDFKPDFIISVHTPLGVLDLDGPKVKNPPAFRPLPWVSLGNFPGSLGRYMWADRKIPVLTIELKGNQALQNLEDFDRLQDVSGTVAIQANQVSSPIK